MTDLRPLSREGSDFEVELLRAGRQDAMPEKSGHSILAGLGLAPATAVAASGKLALLKITLVVAGAGGVGALGLWGGQDLLSASSPTAAVASQRTTATTNEASTSVAPALSSGSPGEQRKLETRPQPEAAQSPTSDITKPPTVHRDTGSRSVFAAENLPSGPNSQRVSPLNGKPRARPAKTDTLGRELQAIDAARSALASGDHVRAGRLLDAYATEFPSPRLHTEATVLRIETLTASGQRAAALRLGNAFLKRDPNSPYARRVRSLIGVPDAAD